jgi:hypothetical protein
MPMAIWGSLGTLWKFAEDVSTVIFIVGAVAAVLLWFAGVLPVLIRLGNLRKRKIAIFAKGDASGSLRALFEDARLFKAKNIISITSAADFGRSESATIFVVHWPDWQADLEQILSGKGDQTPLVIYAPQAADPLPPNAVRLIDQHRHVVVANFRGRLLNDVVSSFVTTAYEKR